MPPVTPSTTCVSGFGDGASGEVLGGSSIGPMGMNRRGFYTGTTGTTWNSVSRRIQSVYELRRTESFERWFERLRDARARARILARLDLIAVGHFGDVHSVGDGVAELRINLGPGYRIYFLQKPENVIAL